MLGYNICNIFDIARKKFIYLLLKKKFININKI